MWNKLNYSTLLELSWGPSESAGKPTWHQWCRRTVPMRIHAVWSFWLFSTSPCREAGDSLNDCRIILVDEIYKIEEPGSTCPLSARPLKRESVAKIFCSLSLWGSKVQDTRSCDSLTISSVSWRFLESEVTRGFSLLQDKVGLCVKLVRTTPTRPAEFVLAISVEVNKIQINS